MDLVHALLGLLAVVAIFGAAALGAWLLDVTPLRGPRSSRRRRRGSAAPGRDDDEDSDRPADR